MGHGRAFMNFDYFLSNLCWVWERDFIIMSFLVNGLIHCYHILKSDGWRLVMEAMGISREGCALEDTEESIVGVAIA